MIPTDIDQFIKINTIIIILSKAYFQEKYKYNHNFIICENEIIIPKEIYNMIQLESIGKVTFKSLPLSLDMIINNKLYNFRIIKNIIIRKYNLYNTSYTNIFESIIGDYSEKYKTLLKYGNETDFFCIKLYN